MSGIYLHIPFCKQACHYCDFHFSTQLDLQQAMVEAMCSELEQEKNYLQNETIATIYFGGGTPSLLSEQQLYQIFETIYKYFQVVENPEITLEANPDDICSEKLTVWKKIGINRLSIGIQSFHEPHLKFMNRVHTAQEAENCVILAQNNGFQNITIDLIYGIPSETHQIWQNDLNKAIRLNVPHISAYCLTIEEKTVFGNWQKKGKITIQESYQAEQYEILIQQLEKYNFEQYEISNFAQNQQYAKHNTAYWQQKKYLGIGPSAHSFNGISRRYNVSHNVHYIKAMKQQTKRYETEILTQAQQVNEYILTTLRTRWGTSIQKIEHFFPNWADENQKKLAQFQTNHWIELKDQHIYLTAQGKLLADAITQEFLVLD
jgi:oxygen-independent coproporphyrinogen-3 oxidase